MPEHFYVYPAYLEKVSRAAGRRVPAGEALVDVSAEEIVEAARHLGVKAEAEPAKQYPRRFYTYAGRVKVTKKAGTPKTKLLRALAGELRRRRAQGAHS
jgi:signal recognition particle subunit SEC65